MKMLSIGGVLGVAYIAFQAVNMNTVFGLYSAKHECDEAISRAAVQSNSVNSSAAMKEMDAACDRFTKKAAATSQVLSALH